jgi:ethanolamine permease
VIAGVISALIFLGFLLNVTFQPAIIAIVIVYALILVGFAVWGRRQLVLSPEEEYALSGGLHGDPEKDGYGGTVAEGIRTDDLDPTGHPKA